MPSVPVDTSRGVEFYSHWYAPHSPWPKPRLNWLRLPDRFAFDLDRARRQLEEIQERYGLQPFRVRLDRDKKRMSYRGIGLTCRAGADDPLYDALGLYGPEGALDISKTFDSESDRRRSDQRRAVPLHERHFTERTAVYTGYLGELLDRFRSPKTKCRLLELRPRGVITSHVDFPYYQQIRLHASITTNEQVWYEVEGERFQIPADGRFYWFDTGKYHAVWNDGPAPRVNLSVNLALFDPAQMEPRGPDELLERLCAGDL